MCIDTVPKIIRKTKIEKKLRQLEQDILLVETNPYVYVYWNGDDNDRTSDNNKTNNNANNKCSNSSENVMQRPKIASTCKPQI